MKNLLIMLLATIAFNTISFAQKLSADKVPSAVSKAFQEKFPKVTDVKWELEAKTDYEANFKLNGTKTSAKFNESGKWMETETDYKVADLPQSVKDLLAKDYAGYKI